MFRRLPRVVDRGRTGNFDIVPALLNSFRSSGHYQPRVKQEGPLYC